MAKASFERDSMVWEDRGTLVPPRRDNSFTINAGLGRPAIHVDQNTPVPLSGNRTLFHEDFSPAEVSRIESRQREFQASIKERYAKAPENVVNSMVPVNESLEETASRIMTTGRDWLPSVTHPEEGTQVPGSGWYFNQHKFYSENSGTKDPEAIDRAIIGGGAMSPQNDPVLERAAGVELSRAHVSNEHVVIPKHIADWVNHSHTYTDKGDQRKTQKAQLTSEQIGTEVSIRDLHPEIISTLKSAKRRELFPEFDENSKVNWGEIAKGSTNVTAGVRGVRGEPIEKVAPAQSSPKVNSYIKSILNYSDVTPKHADLYNQLVSSAVHGTPAPEINKTFKLSDELAEHVLQMFGKGTTAFDPRDRAVQQVELNRGRIVHSDALHPAIVQALGHRSVAVNHPDVHLAAITSTNHPTVADTWMNAAVMGQPQATVLPAEHLSSRLAGTPTPTPTNVTSLYKQGGTNLRVPTVTSSGKETVTDVKNTGYMSEKNGLLDTTKGNAGIQPKTIQHAINDKIIRLGASMSGELYGTGVSLPSTAAQESIGWTIPRAVAGKDKTRKGRRGN